MFGTQITQLRTQRGYSLRGLAKRINVSPGFLSRIENDHRQCSVTIAEALDRALQTGNYLAKLAALPVHHPHNALQIGHPEMDRRSMLRAMVFTTGAAAINTTIDSDVGHRYLGDASHGVFGHEAVTACRVQLDALRAFDEQYGGAHGSMALTGLFAEVSDYLSHHRPDTRTTRSDMLGIAAEIAFLRGWKAHDVNNEGFAQREFMRAQVLAEESQIPGHDAWTLRAQAMQACDIGQPADALTLGAEARRRVVGMGGHIEGLMIATAARTAADNGEHAVARRYLRQVEPFTTTAFDDATPSFVQALCPNMANLHIKIGQTLMAMGAHRDAVEYFEAGRDLWSRRTHARVYAMDSYLIGDTYYEMGEYAAAEQEWRLAIAVGSGVDSARCARQRDQIQQRMPHIVAGTSGGRV